MIALSFLLSLSACLLWTGAEGQNSGDLRLVARNGQTSPSLTAGRLEVYYNGQWGTVCDNQFEGLEASTACGQLGFQEDFLYFTNVGSTSSGLSTRFTSASTSTPTWFESLNCDFSDTRLIDCASSIGIESCSHDEDVVLYCRGNGAMRLSTSVTASVGLVEVYYNGVWGTVCGNSFDKTDADVACRQLGYPSASSYGNAVSLGYGRSVGTIWLTNLGCTSSDLMLSTCSNSGFGNTFGCSHSDDVAVTCNAFSIDFGLSTAAIIGIVLAGVGVTIIVITICIGACITASCRRGRRRNVNAAAVVTGTGNAPPPYTSTAYPVTQPQEGAPAAYPQQQPPAAYPDEQKVELQEYQADPAYPLQPPPTN